MGYNSNYIKNIVLQEPDRNDYTKSKCCKKNHAKGSRV